MPFRTNATCTIRPEGLIAENYVDCDPGTLPAPILRAHGRPAADGAGPEHDRARQPARPVQHLQRPDPRAVHAIIDELGIGTAGEGQNFNDILLRANPALARRAR